MTRIGGVMILDTSEVAGVLGVSKASVNYYAQQGYLPCFKIYRVRLYQYPDVVKFKETFTGTKICVIAQRDGEAIPFESMSACAAYIGLSLPQVKEHLENKTRSRNGWAVRYWFPQRCTFNGATARRRGWKKAHTKLGNGTMDKNEGGKE